MMTKKVEILPRRCDNPCSIFAHFESCVTVRSHTPRNESPFCYTCNNWICSQSEIIL